MVGMMLTRRKNEFVIGRFSRLVGITCNKCKRKLKLNDNVFARTTSSANGQRYYYHKKCWDRLFL
jgi:hypothetical protein